VLVHHVSIPTQVSEVGLYADFANKLQHGLTLFFVLSGFLLFRPFASSILAGKPLPSIRRYAANRLLRIYPVYLVILLVSGVMFDAAYRYGSPQTSPADYVGRIDDPWTLIADVLLVQTYIPGKIVYPGKDWPAWSLSVEIALYVLLPLLALCSSVGLPRRLPRMLAVFMAPATLIAVGLGTNLVPTKLAGQLGGGPEFAWGQNWISVLSRRILAQTDFFAYGMIGAVVVCLIQRRGTVSLPGWSKGLLLAGGDRDCRRCRFKPRAASHLRMDVHRSRIGSPGRRVACSRPQRAGN
jgi:peptidoglycan/LPS O-acetylase OafA/YrhL